MRCSRKESSRVLRTLIYVSALCSISVVRSYQITSVPSTNPRYRWNPHHSSCTVTDPHPHPHPTPSFFRRDSSVCTLQAHTNKHPNPNPVSPSWDKACRTALLSLTTAATLFVSCAFTPVPANADNVVDEVWKLTDKYYIDATYQQQDWNAVRTQYNTLDGDHSDTSKSFALASKLVSGLGDKYSRVINVDTYAKYQRFDMVGVGIPLITDGEKRVIVAAPPVKGSSSAREKLRVGDVVAAVNGVSTTNREPLKIVEQIEENPTAKTVTFSMKREDQGVVVRNWDVVLERQFEEVSDPTRYKLQTRSDGTKVGYIKITEFNSLVVTKLTEALQELKSKGATAYVLDVRSNPGGAFQSATEIAGLFLNDEVATIMVGKNGDSYPFRTTSGKVVLPPSDPVVIWVDQNTASASEVLTAALRDNCRAVVMGKTPTFGKGKIQAVYGLENGGGLILTVAKYVGPNGTPIDGRGVTPDIVTDLPMYVPGFSSDTSKLDFDQIRNVRKNMCADTEMKGTDTTSTKP